MYIENQNSKLTISVSVLNDFVIYLYELLVIFHKKNVIFWHFFSKQVLEYFVNQSVSKFTETLENKHTKPAIGNFETFLCA